MYTTLLLANLHMETLTDTKTAAETRARGDVRVGDSSCHSALL